MITCDARLEAFAVPGIPLVGRGDDVPGAWCASRRGIGHPPHPRRRPRRDVQAAFACRGTVRRTAARRTIHARRSSSGADGREGPARRGAHPT